MGPTNLALVKLYHAEQTLREAQRRLEQVTRGVRVQERKLADLVERLAISRQKLLEAQAKSGGLELDIKSRDERIERLRLQQQDAKNNKEYQAFLIEINTEKVDKSKNEDDLLKVMELVEVAQKEVNELAAQHSAEDQKLSEMRKQIGESTKHIEAEIQALKPVRDTAAADVPDKILVAFERLANHHDGEAMAALTKPDPRREEYSCTVCSMDLVVNIYFKLHTRDEVIFCPSCRRILYIPDDLPAAAKKKSASNRSRNKSIAGATMIGAMAPRQESAIDVLNSMSTDDEDEPEATEAKE